MPRLFVIRIFWAFCVSLRTSKASVAIHKFKQTLPQKFKQTSNFTFADLILAPRGMPQIEVTFNIDANGILTVSAKDKATGKAQEIKITGSSGLSEEEIEKMVKDAELHKEEDKKRKEIIDARNQAEALAHQVEKSLNELGEKIPQEDKDNIQKALDELREVLKNENASKEEIESKMKALSDASHKIAETMYKKDGATDGEASGKGKKDDDVIDAEVE